MLMLLSLSACGEAESPSEPSNSEPAADIEIQKATELGFVPDALQNDYDAQISYAEFCSILDAMLEGARPECLAEWAETSSGFHDAEDVMTRFEGMLVLFYAAECAGVEDLCFWESVGLEEQVPEGMDFWEGITEYPLLPGAFEPYENEDLAGTDYAWLSGQDYANAAAVFTSCCSFGNGKTFFDYDENYMLRFGDTLTRGDAIRAAERLYETIHYATYVPPEALPECGVTEESLALAAQMPEARYDALPDWTGCTLIDRIEYNRFGLGRNYTEEEVEAAALAGFNFVRVPLKFELLFQGTDMTQVCAAYLETLDNLLNWCAERGIHVCFDLHDLPGFTTDGDDSNDILFWDEESQDCFVGFWQLLAERYQDVPSNLLSFNLLNEPHGNAENELTDELYSAVMLKAIDAVRTVSPDRLMIAGTLGVTWGAPVRGLAGAGVAQGFSGYILANRTEQWPYYYINQCFNSAEGDIVLRGDFPAGTELSIRPFAYVSAEYAVSSNGNVLCSVAVDGENYEGTGCSVTSGEAGIEWSGTDQYMCTITLLRDSGEIRISEASGSGYGELLGIVIRDDSHTVMLSGDVTQVSHPAPATLTITEDGSVTAEEPASLRPADRASICEMLQPYLDFRAETGVDFMILECGANHSIRGDVACAFAEDFLSALDECGISWCCWAGDFSPLTHQQMSDWAYLYRGEQWVREGHSYENVTENFVVDTTLMEKYQAYMK